MFTSLNTISLSTLFLVLLALATADTAVASPLSPPGRHAPPYLASALGNHKRALASWLKGRTPGKVLNQSSTEGSYYGASYGLTAPSRASGSSQHASEKRAISTTMPTGWTYTGCLTESSNVRLLSSFGFSSTYTTSSLCATICGQMGYTISGTEYGDECYCGNSYNGVGGAVNADSDCSMACAGDSSQSCGNSWRLSVYTFNSTSSSSSTAASASTIASSVTVASTQSVTATAPGSTGTASVAQSGTATSSAATVTSTSTSDGAVSEWSALGCSVDSDTSRVLDGAHYYYQSDLTIDDCLNMCEDAGYTYAGLEWAEECHCGNTLGSTLSYVADSQCAMACTGDSSETCGAGNRIELYKLESESDCDTTTTSSTTSTNLLGAVLLEVATSSSVASSTSVAKSVTSSTSASVATSTAATTTATYSDATATGVVETVSTDIPSTSNSHAVYAHHMVGNTYPYAQSDWATDISLAKAAGIDGFALNMGSDYWQPARVADAYAAAVAAGDFVLFLSLDMTSLGCSSVADLAIVIALVRAYSGSSAQALHNSQVLVSTFSGESCTFGASSVSQGWTNFQNGLSLVGADIFFVPSIFSDTSTFSSDSWMDGELNWNSGWPTGSADLTTASDVTYMNALGSKEYMPAISPFFFTHFPPSGWNKNWIYRSDDFLFANRWEQVIAMRNENTFTEILTWNDFGESSYIGPIAGGLPSGSEVWTNGFPHVALLDVTAYYATAYKTGAYPAITEDKIIWWARPHPKAATASADTMVKPTGWDNTDDNVYALVFATSYGVVTLTSGSNSERYTVQSGLNKIKLAMSAGSVTAKLRRNGADVLSYDSTGSFTYTETPTTYNFNYFVGTTG